jgi:hypothetical protein
MLTTLKAEREDDCQEQAEKILMISPTMFMKIKRTYDGCPESPTMLLKTKGQLQRELDKSHDVTDIKRLIRSIPRCY